MSIDSDTAASENESGKSTRNITPFLAVALLVVLLGGALLSYRMLNRIRSMDAELDSMKQTVERTSQQAQAASERAEDAERSARNSKTLREQAEEETAQAAMLADTAARRAELAEADAASAKKQAEKVQQQAEAEMNRLEEALGKIAETRRTALGLVMNLDDSSLKFDFDKAELRPENREMLARIAGILLTSDNFTISVNGHTDARGTEEYNQVLSEKRAQSVGDYLMGAGLSQKLFTVQGFGKSQPLEPGAGPSAHAKNRRVELGIVNSRIKYYTNRQ